MGFSVMLGVRDTDLVLHSKTVPLIWNILFEREDYQSQFSFGKQIFTHAIVNTSLAMKRLQDLLIVGRKSRIAWKYFYPALHLLDLLEEFKG